MNTPHVPHIFDRRRASAKWDRARDRNRLNNGANYLAETIGDEIAERLDFMRFKPETALLIGDIAGQLQSDLKTKGTHASVLQLGEFDEEQPGPDAAYDLIVHMLGLGMVNDLPGALLHTRRALREGGLFMAAFPGAGSLRTLRRITLAADGERPAARLHPQIDSRAGTALLERAGFARQVVDTFPMKVRFPSIHRLLEDLRDHGLTCSLTSPAPPITREWLARAQTEFDTLREEDGKVTEIFEILVLTGWR